jgi:hypothetical protein
MAYNLTNISGNETGLLSIFQGVNNNIMGGSFGNLMILGIWAVMYTAILVNTGDHVKAGMTSFFICFVLSLSLLAIDLVAPIFMFILLIGLGLYVALSMKGG